jgi:hypothetical protein
MIDWTSYLHIYNKKLQWKAVMIVLRVIAVLWHL